MIYLFIYLFIILEIVTKYFGTVWSVFIFLFFFLNGSESSIAQEI